MRRRLLCACAAMLAATASALATDATGAGSTFVFPILSKWAAEFAAKTGNRVNYQSIGSGGGIAQIKASTIDFGASDVPLKSEDLQKLGLGQFPLVIGGVVPVVNVEGIRPGQLRFTGSLLADIFLGKVKTWSDPEIQRLNPGLKLPNNSIAVVHRSDGSGTTFNWVNYLSKVSADWRSAVGEGTSVQWPTGLGSKGNEGVAATVMQTRGSIGYVEYAYVLQNKMIYALVQNKAGQYVRPDSDSFQAAAESADWASAQDFSLIMTDAPGENAYPITATVFVLMYKRPVRPDSSKVAKELFSWAMKEGQPQANALGYVPLPTSLVKQIDAYWKAHFAM